MSTTATHISGEPQPLECDEIRWVTMDSIEAYPFPKANIHIIEALKEYWQSQV